MAKQFIFKENDIIEIDKAYLSDMLCFNDNKKNKIENNVNINLNNLDKLYKLTGVELKHIHVLRYKVKDIVVINNMECEIIYFNKDYAIVNKLNKLKEKGIPNINLTLYQAFLKSEKMDYLIQKSVELGIKNISPFFSKNTVVKLDNKDKIKRKEKFEKICTEATKQCNRTDIVSVNEFINFNEMLKKITEHEFCIFAYENEKENIKKVLERIKENINKDENKKIYKYKDIAIVVGPEGGFDIKEVEELKKIQNVYTVGLGERILRAETASINLISILMYEFD